MNVREHFTDHVSRYHVYVTNKRGETRRAWYWWQQGQQSCPWCCLGEVKLLSRSYCTNKGCDGLVTRIEQIK